MWCVRCHESHGCFGCCSDDINSLACWAYFHVISIINVESKCNSIIMIARTVHC